MLEEQSYRDAQDAECLMLSRFQLKRYRLAEIDASREETTHTRPSPTKRRHTSRDYRGPKKVQVHTYDQIFASGVFEAFRANQPLCLPSSSAIQAARMSSQISDRRWRSCGRSYRRLISRATGLRHQLITFRSIEVTGPTAIFALILSTFSLFGITMVPLLTAQLMTTCAGVPWCFSAMATTSVSVKKIGLD
ncbi:hypothetical protein AcW1_010282 [Taiwanofungus camphoratus]|nr:hypothetical protein AcV5_010434 [Antrodia cinnamomea]KAI0941804.1 hypothetical protein AcW1_010282 [Antrodia cinnamomea]KAI0960699.1 hypothetical protein AcV7_010338 [Antrodia cinnamomea]